MTTQASTDATAGGTRNPLYSALIGLTTLVILLQGVWAGLFKRVAKGHSGWVDVHNWGARIAIILAVVAAGVAIVKLSQRRDLVIGTAVLAVLLIIEMFVGSAVENHPNVRALHYPLAMALLALAIWLPTRDRLGRRTAATPSR